MHCVACGPSLARVGETQADEGSHPLIPPRSRSKPGDSTSGAASARDPRIVTPSARNRLRSLQGANRSLVSEHSLAGVLRRIVEAAREVSAARYAALGVIGPDGTLEEFVHVGMDEATVKAIGDLPRGRGVLGRLIDEPHTIRLHAIAEDARSSGFPSGHPPMQTFLGVPIQAGDEVFGNLYLTDREGGGGFTAEDEELVTALAATASIAIENARLYEDGRHGQDWLRASAEISRDLLDLSSSQDELLDRIADNVLGLADADLVAIALRASDRTELEVRVARGVDARALTGFRYAEAGSLSGLAIATGRAIRIDPFEDGEHLFIHLQSQFHIGPVMACPLVSKTGTRGVVVVGRLRGRRPFTQGNVDMAQAFTAQAAIALELADAREDQQRLSLLEDRDRIARDLHDHVIQRLFAAGLSVQSAASTTEDPRLSDRLTRSVEDIDETIRQIRSAIFELHDRRGPLHFTPRGVVLAVVDDIERALGLRPVVTFRGPVDTVLDDELLHDVEAVVREGLSNVARHTTATGTALRIVVEADLVTVELHDDGTAPPRLDRRSGLANLESRAHARGGSLRLHHDDEGTHLRWSATLTS